MGVMCASWTAVEGENAAAKKRLLLWMLIPLVSKRRLTANVCIFEYNATREECFQ